MLSDELSLSSLFLIVGGGGGVGFSHLAQTLVSPSLILTCNLLKEASSPSSGSTVLAAASYPTSGNHHQGGCGAQSLALGSSASRFDFCFDFSKLCGIRQVSESQP